MADPFKIIEPTAIGFSGGRTSAYMLWRVLQSNNGMPDDLIVSFQNTGKEEEATLEFVRDCGEKWGVPIVWLEYIPNGIGYKEVTFQTASRLGEPFEAVIKNYGYLPNGVNRLCTGQLKIRPQAKYMASTPLFAGESYSALEGAGWVGIRADEQRRAAKISDKSRIPLWTAGITKQDVGAFWREQSFDLALPNINGVTMHGNCDLCFHKPTTQILSLIAEKPERAVWWARMEDMASKTSKTPSASLFHLQRPSYSVLAKFAADQSDMFDTAEESIPCFCGD